jgi:thiol-disulfide isomerase/thioredoxin
MSKLAAAARRHPGVSFVAVPCTVLALAVLALWPDPRPAPGSAGPGVPVAARIRPAPDLSRSLLTGTGDVTPQQFHGAVVVVNFWASWCPPCRDEAARLRALARESRGTVFLGVDEQDTRSGGQGFLRRYRPGYRSVFDPSGSLLHAFGSIGVPSTYILDRRGRIRYQAFGPIDPAAVKGAIARLTD